MRYHDITTNDMKNGDGLRTVLWLSGCSHHCKGCHNPITWDPDDGLIFDDKAETELLEKLNHEEISGLTLSGGDPLFHSNLSGILELVKKVKKEFPDKTIWMYTGNVLSFDKNTLDQESIVTEILSYIDVAVDGPFIEELKDVEYHWGGSTNQRVLNIQESLKKGSPILWESIIIAQKSMM